jgi:hypothetical protein
VSSSSRIPSASSHANTLDTPMLACSGGLALSGIVLSSFGGLYTSRAMTGFSTGNTTVGPNVNLSEVLSSATIVRATPITIVFRLGPD